MNALNDITETTGLFYYITMKDFERREYYKTKKKYKKLDSNEKRELFNIIRNKRDEVFNIRKLCQNILTRHLEINNYEELFDFFSSINFIDFIRNANILDTYFRCNILKGNLAWISKSDIGHYRYFSKSKNSETIGFDLIDLLEIYFGLSTSQTIEHVIKLFKIKFMEGIWMNEQNKKYISNLTIIHNADKYLKPDYPLVYKYIRKHLKILETINVLGNINVKKKEFSFENHNIFFASNSYIADFLGNYTISTTNKILNLFAVLGFIRKVPEENIPPQLLHESKVIAEKRNLGNIITYYIVPHMMDVLDIAKERAFIMEQHNIRYSNISKEKISFAFGKEFANQIYVQEIQKNKLKNTTPIYLVQRCLEYNFLELLENNSYVSKKELIEVNIPNTTINQRKREIEKIWKSLIIKHNLKFVKPSNAMKEKYNLKNNEYIVVKEENIF